MAVYDRQPYGQEDIITDNGRKVSKFKVFQVNQKTLRIIGALLGIELVKDRNTKEKAADEAEKILYECLENELSFKIPQGNILTLAPPLIITEEELEYAMDIVEKAIKKYFSFNER